MSTTGTEKHCRLCLMLNKGGTKACHGLLLKRVMELSPKDHTPYPWTVQQFLESNRKTIKKSKISKNKFNVLFPNTGDTDLSKWDLSLYCTVLMLYCQLSLVMHLDVKQFQSLRNDLCHMNEPHISDLEFKERLELIQVVIGRILEKIGNPSLKLEIESIMNSLETEPLSLGETLKEMHKFYLMEVDIREKLEHVEERILQEFEKLGNKCEDIKRLVQSNDANVLIPGVDIFLDLNNITEDEEENMSAVLCKLFEEVINEDDEFKSSITNHSHVKLREVSLKTFKLFLSKGWRIVSAQHECVLLHIKCDSFKSLACLFREQSNGQIEGLLTDLKQALREYMHGREICIETTIYKDEFWSVLKNSISSVEEFLSKCEVGPFNPSDDGQQCHDGSRHTLTLSAKNVWTEHGHQDRSNDLNTCLQALKTDLEAEFRVQNIPVKTSTWAAPNSDDADTDQDIEVETEINDESQTITPTQTVGNLENLSLTYEGPLKQFEITMGSKHQSVETLLKDLSMIEIESKISTNVEKEENKGIEKKGREKILSDIAMESTSTFSKEDITASVEKEPAFPQNALHGIIEAKKAVLRYLELAFLTLFDTQLQEMVSNTVEEMMDAVDVMNIVTYIKSMAEEMLIFDYISLWYDVLPLVKKSLGTIDDISRQIERLRRLVLELESHIKIKKSTIQTSKKAMESYSHLPKICKNEETFSQECQQHLKNITAKSFFQQEVMKPVKPTVSDDIHFDEIEIEAETKFALKTMKSQQKQEKFPKPPSSEQTKYDYVIPFDVKPCRSDVKPDRNTSLDEALMEMLRPGKALLSDRKDLDPNFTQKHSAGLKTLFTDPIFEDNSEFLDEVKTFYSEVIKHQEKGYTESLQLQGEQICYRCIQRMEEHLKILEVHVKRMSMVLSRIISATDYIDEASHMLHSSDQEDLKKEWKQVREITNRLRFSKLWEHPFDIWRKVQLDRKEELKRILQEFSSLAEYEPQGKQSKKEIEKEKSQIVK